MPFTHREAPPAAAARRIGSTISSGTTPAGYWRNTGELDTTLTPARRSRSRSASASVIRSSAIAV
jgi:hypothetical protein